MDGATTFKLGITEGDDSEGRTDGAVELDVDGIEVG